MIISKHPRHSHLFPSVWQWNCQYLFLRFRSVATGDRTRSPAHEANVLPLRHCSGVHPWVKGILGCSNEEPHNFLRGDNYEIVKIYKIKKIFISRTTVQFQPNLLQHVIGWRVFKFVQMKGHALFQKNYVIAKNTLTNFKNFLFHNNWASINHT